MLRFFSFFLVLSILLACKNEPPQVIDANTSQFEQEYFEDYDSPSIKWGYIDSESNKVIDAIYDDTRDFRDGLALANYEGRWGYINTKGENVIPHQYVEASSFTDGAALVKAFDGSHKFIGRDGKEMFSVDVEEIKEFNHGLALFKKGNFWGAYNKKGNVVINPIYSRLKILTDKVLSAKDDKEYHLIDHKGASLSDFVFDKIYWDEDYPFVIKHNNQFFLIEQDLTGKIETSYDKVEAFHGKYALALKAGKYFLIDKKAKQVKEFPYDRVEYGGEGKWKYRQDGLWGLMDEDGEILTEPKFYLLNRYTEGRMVYGMSEDLWGFLDEKGEIIVDPIFPLLWDYHNGMARIITGSGFGFIDKEGKVAIKPQFIEARDFNDGLARAQIIW